jgi:hypothetical protein
LLGNMIRGLHYDPTTYTILIAELERLYGGADQEIATTALDLFKCAKVQLLSLESVRAFRVKLQAYRATLDTYHKREAEFAPNSQLYREIQDRKFTQPDLMRFHDRRSDKGWPDSAEGILEWLDHHQSILESLQQASKTPTPFPKDQLNIAFTTVEDHDVRCTGNEIAVHQIALDDNYVFHVQEDTPLEVVDHMLGVSRKSGRQFMKNEECDWKREHCKENHLMRDCPIYNAVDNRGKLDHMMKVGRCFNCYRKGHRLSACTSKLRCRAEKCGAKHNSALHKAWIARTNAVSLLTKMVSPISLLTSPVMVATDNSYLKKETNFIQDNGATLSLMSKEIADAIGLTGETRPLGMLTIGTTGVQSNG